MPTLHAGDAVDLLDGGEVVAKGRVISTDPASTVHGQPMPLGHVSVTVIRVLKGTTYIPYPPHRSQSYAGWQMSWDTLYHGLALL